MIDKPLITYLRKKLIAWGEIHFKNYPWRSTKNPWHALVAEIMLQRTKADQVLPVYNDFAKRFPKPIDYLKHVKTTDENIFKELGLTWRHRVFKETVKSVVEEGIPEYKKKLTLIPGVGDYVASAFLAFHLNKRELIIDSNIVRFLGRFLDFETNNETRRKIWFIEIVDKITPKKNVKGFNYALLDFSMIVCKFKPLCSNCPLRRKCLLYKELKNR